MATGKQEVRKVTPGCCVWWSIPGGGKERPGRGSTAGCLPVRKLMPVSLTYACHGLQSGAEMSFGLTTSARGAFA